MRKAAAAETQCRQDQQQRRQEIEQHLTLPRDLVADVQENALARALLLVAHIVAGRGDEQDQPRERSECAGEHPRREESAAVPRVERAADRHEDDRHGEVLDRPRAEQPHEEHGEYRPHTAFAFAVCQSSESDVVRQETEQSERRRPEIDRRAAFPHGHLAKMRDAEPCEDKRGGEQSGTLMDGNAPPRMHGEQHDEQEEYERVRDVKGNLARQQERVEEKEGDHAPAVLAVVPQERVEHIGKCSDVNARVPDHRIVVVVTVQRHKVVERKHQREDQHGDQHRLYAITVHIPLLNAQAREN